MRDDRFIYKVVEMYYRKGMSQLQIGKKLNVSRTTVFRALEKAKKEGYVQVVINRPQGLLISKEEALGKSFICKKPLLYIKKRRIRSPFEKKLLIFFLIFYCAPYIMI